MPTVIIMPMALKKRGNPVTAVQSIHRVFVAPDAHGHDADDAGDQTEGTDHQGENNPGYIFEIQVKCDTEDHRADVFSGGRFKKVGAAAGAITDVITHQVGNDGGIARIVFRNAGFNLAHQVGAHIGGFSVNTAAQLGEEGDEAGAETEAQNQVRRDIRMTVSAIGEENYRDPDQAEDHDQETRHRRAAQSGLDGFIQALLRSRGGAAVGFDGNDHADESRHAGADRAHQEGDARPPGIAEG